MYEIAKGSNTITTLASFNGTGGEAPNDSGVILNDQGNLYGIHGGTPASGDGYVYEIAKGSNTITTLASLNGTNGGYPDGGVVLDGQGNLYGTTNFGGIDGDGTVFEIDKGSNTITTLASFNGTDGANPYASVILDGQGNLYGTTNFGGSYGDGTVFEIALGSNTITTLASFNGTDGANPIAGVILDSQGNLYGTTPYDGAYGSGTVYEIAKGSNTITTLTSFSVNQSVPIGGLAIDGLGDLYGTTYLGGASNDGTVFELSPSQNVPIVPTTLELNADGTADFSYQVTVPALPAATTIGIYWGIGGGFGSRF